MAKKQHHIETPEEKKSRYELPTEHFFWLGIINNKKPYDKPEDIDLYPSFMVNKGLSYYADTILAVNYMNANSHLSNKMQFDFLQALVPKAKRYEKWLKPDKHEDISVLQDYYGVNRNAGKEMLETINKQTDGDSILEDIYERASKGGKVKTVRDSS